MLRWRFRGLRSDSVDAPPVVEGLDLSLRRGEILAVMGPSGSGKSTLLECLSGLRAPRRGLFRIDGHELSAVPIELSVLVEQRPYLFVGTIRENLLLGNRNECTDQDLWDALGSVGLEDTIRSRGGLEEVLADRGLNMSEGQRYRLALCRALLAQRSFVLLDEPFAALDGESIELVVEVLRRERDRGVGIVVVTHVEPRGLEPDQIVNLDPAEV